MQITTKNLEKNQIELTIEVSQEEIKPHLEKAATKLSITKKLPGFRPGKAPYEMVKKQFGEMALLQEALQYVIADSFYKAVTKEKLQTIGQPEIKVEKIAPENPVIYKAIVSLLPKITLGEWQKLSVKKQAVIVNDIDVNKTIEQLQNMNAQESIVNEAAKTGDKVELNFEVLIDKVIIEGGKSSKYPLVIGEGQMIPGFEEQIIGLKAKDKKEFELKFPEKYFQKTLANKLATFKVEVLNVYKRELPKLDDVFAKTMGFESMTQLRKQLFDNIKQDKENKEAQRVENAAIDEIIKISTIEEIPETLISNEIHKMIHELEQSIAQRGMDMAGYLKSLNKTHDDLHKDFREQAIQRIKAALVMRQLAQEEKIKADDKEIDAEIKKQTEIYKDSKEVLQNIQHPNYRDHLANVMINKKVIKLIADTIIK